MARTILPGHFNFIFLSRERNYGVILLGQILHLTARMGRRNMWNGRWRMLRLCLGSLEVWNPPCFSISSLISPLEKCGITWRTFTTKAIQHKGSNWNSSWVSSVKVVCQYKSFILHLQIFRLSTPMLCMQAYLLKDSLLSKMCMRLTSMTSF